MLEFPSARNDRRLDVVSILAILGENNIKFNAHLINLSWTCLLPRLLPAPQGLLSERMKVLPYEEDVKVWGISSGNRREGLNYFATVLHGSGLGLEPYTTRELRITRIKDSKVSMFKLKRFGPLNSIAVASSFVSLGLLIWAILIRDGLAPWESLSCHLPRLFSASAQNGCSSCRIEAPQRAPRGMSSFGTVKASLPSCTAQKRLPALYILAPSSLPML
jgi:hypothetical protein